MPSKYKLSCSHSSVPSHWGQGSGTSRWLRICPRFRGIWRKSQAWTAGIQALQTGCSVLLRQGQPALTRQTSTSARHTLWAGTPGASDSGPSCPAARPLHVSASPRTLLQAPPECSASSEHGLPCSRSTPLHGPPPTSPDKLPGSHVQAAAPGSPS